MEDVISEAKAELLRAKSRIVTALTTTPDDKIGWSPAPTARTPIELVAHSALGISGIQEVLAGKPFPFSDMTAADTEFRAAEKEFATREQALGLLEKNTAAYVAWLDTLTAEQIGATFTEFGRPIAMASAITFAADHLRNHAAQLEYIQTIYGDREWRM